MDTVQLKIYLGSVPGHLSEVSLANLLSQQVYSFVKVETTKSYGRDRVAKNNGFAFMTVSDQVEYDLLVSHNKMLTIDGRSIKASVYKSGTALKSETIMASSKKIYIRGIPPSMTDKELFSTLKAAGLNPSLAFCAQKSSTLEKKHFGFAEFSSVKEAGMALDLRSISIPNRKDEYLIFEKFQAKYKNSSNPDHSFLSSPTSSNQAFSETYEGLQTALPTESPSRLVVDQQNLAYNKLKYCICQENQLEAPYLIKPLLPESSFRVSRASCRQKGSVSPDRIRPLDHSQPVLKGPSQSKAGSIFGEGLNVSSLATGQSPYLEGRSHIVSKCHSNCIHPSTSRSVKASRGPFYSGILNTSINLIHGGEGLSLSRVEKLQLLDFASGFHKESSETSNLTRHWLESVKAYQA